MDDLKRLDNGVIDLSQFRKQKQEEDKMEPLFTEPTIITLGDPNDPEREVKYLLLVNLVINGKQFLALESMEPEDKGQVAIVEALVENGQFVGVQIVQTEEEFEEVVGIMTQALQASGQQEEGDLNDNKDH